MVAVARELRLDVWDKYGRFVGLLVDRWLIVFGTWSKGCIEEVTCGKNLLNSKLFSHKFDYDGYIVDPVMDSFVFFGESYFRICIS